MTGRINGQFASRDPLGNFAYTLEMVRTCLLNSGYANPSFILETEKPGERNLGFYATHNGRRFWAGVYTKQSHKVTITRLLRGKDYPTNQFDLNQEAFLSLSYRGQVKKLTEFLSSFAQNTQ